jgi:hypothetical protein
VSRAHAEDGDIITTWLGQLVLLLAVFAFVAYEAVAVVVASVSVDDAARGAAREAARTYQLERSLSAAEAAATDTLVGERAEVVAVVEEDGELVLTLHEPARTLLIHRVAALDDLATATATRRVRWRS